MRYLGGKTRIAKKILAHLEPLLADRPYLEPFVGGGSVLEQLAPKVKPGYCWAGDANAALIHLYEEVARGWTPPEHFSKVKWEELKAEQDPTDPMTAFAGFGCSFMAMWFEGYHASEIGPSARALIRQRPAFQATQFLARPFDHWHPARSVVYCDPPYAGTQGYSAPGCGGFDHEHFWNTLRGWARSDNAVFVSEYIAPEGAAELVDEWEVKGRMKSGGRAAERLFRVKP